jgi:hypothetical protein
MLFMGRMNNYYYIVDGLDPEKAEVIRKSLEIIPEIDSATVSSKQGLVEVRASTEVEEQVNMACSVAGAFFRTKVKKKDLV